MDTRIRIRKQAYGMGEAEIVPFRTEIPDEVGTLAMSFLERWGMVTCEASNEEDSAGRQKMQHLEVSTIVERAFDLAEEAYRVAHDRGHMVKLPDLNEVNADFDTRQKEELEESRKAREAKKAAREAQSQS